MQFLALALMVIGLLCLFSGLNQWRWWWKIAWRDSQGRTVLDRYGLGTTRLIFALVGLAFILLGIGAWRRSPLFLLGALVIVVGLWLYLRVWHGTWRKEKRDS